MVKVAKDVKEQTKGASNKVPKGFFRIDKVVNHREEGGDTEYRVQWKWYDESHDEWKKKQDITSAALDEYRERLKRTKIDDAQQKGEDCKKEKLEEQHQLDIEEETDEKFFRSKKRKSTLLTTGIRLKIPRNRCVDTGLPADVKKAEKHMHEMLGHLGWKTIKRGLAQVQGCEGLEKLLEGVGDNRHCTACEITKRKLPPFPTGKTFRLKRVDPLDKCYIDLSGRISEESVFHKFHYYCSSVTRKGFGVTRGLRYKSQSLMGVNKIFMKQGCQTRLQLTLRALWRAQTRTSGLTD